MLSNRALVLFFALFGSSSPLYASRTLPFFFQHGSWGAGSTTRCSVYLTNPGTLPQTVTVKVRNEEMGGATPASIKPLATQPAQECGITFTFSGGGDTLTFTLPPGCTGWVYIPDLSHNQPAACRGSISIAEDIGVVTGQVTINYHLPWVTVQTLPLNGGRPF